MFFETDILHLYLLGQKLPRIESYVNIAFPCSHEQLCSILQLMLVNGDDYSTYLIEVL